MSSARSLGSLTPTRILLAALATGALGPASPAHAQTAAPNPTPAPAPAPADAGTINAFFNHQLPDVIGKARVSFNARLRYEYADQDAAGGGLDPKQSNALTLRSRFGITSGSLYGFQAMLEGENIVSLIPDENYNAAGSNGQPDRTVIADPEVTELNQAWIAYSHWDTLLKAGRQRIVLDNDRFIGDVIWRQNQQTYDALSLESTALDHVTARYSYLWHVNRIYGDVDGLPPANRDFDSDSHVLHLSWNGWKYARVTAYTYLLDLENGTAASRGNSTATYGGYAAGNAPLGEQFKLDYRAEFAWQSDYGDSPLDYQAEYYSLQAGVNFKPVTVGLGYEVLGTDNGQGFRTPLATLHAFNGWADVFLTTPGKGLRDLHPFIHFDLPAGFALRGIYHRFDADSGGGDFGQEYDLLLTKKLGKHWNALAKYAHYDAEDLPYADIDRFWVEVNFNY